MSDPRFFRKYLDMLDEAPATLDVDDSTRLTVDPTAKTIGMQTKVGDNLNLQAAHDFSTAKQGAGTLGMDYQMDPNTSVGATVTQAGYKGQMTPTYQVRGSAEHPDVGKIDARVDQGVMFQGAGKNIRQGNPAIVTANFTDPQGKTITHNTNRNL